MRSVFRSVSLTRRLMAVWCVASASLASTVLAQNLVGNPGFESPGFAGDNFRYLVGPDSVFLTGWATTYDGVQEASYVYRMDRYETVEGNYSVYLNDGDSISTNVSVIAGRSYRFSFDTFAMSLVDDFHITCGGSLFAITDADVSLTTLHGSSGTPVYRYSHTFTALTGGATTLTIENPQNRTDCFACGGGQIDFVQLVALCACPADFNCDTFVNSQDFFDFVAAFFALQPQADFNTDGFLNSQDFFDFLAAFFGGC